MTQNFSHQINHEAIVRDDAEFHGFYASFGKRLLDVTLVVLTAPITLTLVFLFAVLIRIQGGGPALFFQDRVGKDGRIFKFVKLRTMVPDADDVLERHLIEHPEARDEWEHHQKLRDDPRVTGVGRFLRATSLDELPQFWNVLIGQMSLVGPRPMTSNQIDLYPGAAYYTVLPGLTGPWQVGDRNETSFAGRAAFDTAYVQDMTLIGDMKLVFRTASVVLRRTGV